MRRILVIMGIIASLFTSVKGQFLSDLQLTANDPLYTTYAAPMSRSDYKLDQGYRMMWFDEKHPLEFISQRGVNLGMGIGVDSIFRLQPGEFYGEPVITTSYNDIVRFHYRPFKHVKVEAVFNTYSSRGAWYELTITNDHCKILNLQLIPYLYRYNQKRNPVTLDGSSRTYLFKHHKPRDGWMKKHDIPLVEDMYGFFSLHKEALTHLAPLRNKKSYIFQLLKEQVSGEASSEIMAYSGNITLKPGTSVTLRMMHGWSEEDLSESRLQKTLDQLAKVDPAEIVSAAEERYKRIPVIEFNDPEKELMYWSAFTLMHQCMMPPQGECSYNYYVFSREPKWGWGYGGQVFHESLAMVAYALMDPEGAMNSQRVFMERQHENGYINYRTGPYLNENIPRDSLMTSSAPWFNYQNLEVYKITGNRAFLEEAYRSGKAYYRYMNSTRDKDGDGLLEWGAHAVLESVRDARVAVWDKVGWPANFEGPDINAMMVKEARSLAAMADLLNKGAEADKWNNAARKRSELINQYCWDSKDGFYYNVDRKDQDFTFENPNDLKRKEIIGFLPMWAGVARDVQVKKLLEHFDNQFEFNRPYGVPTLSAADAYYNPIGYWNGPIWVQWQYLLARGLRDYGYDKRADDLSERVMKNVIYHLKKDHTFWEFYSADDLQAGWNHAYIWTGIVARMLVDMQQDNIILD